MKFSIPILLLCLISYSVYGQNIEPNSNVIPAYKNTIILTPGLVVIYPTISFQYERVLTNGKAGRYFGVSLGGGVFYDGIKWTTLIYPRAYWLMGKNPSKLELAFGGALAMKWGNEIQTLILPALVIGYRFQKPSQRFVFRFGLALPEGIYAGIGFRF